MPQLWKCPRCGRTFRRENQAHACGTGDRAELLRGKPALLVKLYRAMEKTLKATGKVEVVTRGRYALFRTTRIFADVVFMRDGLRLAILLGRDVTDPIFFKKRRMSSRRFAAVTMIPDAARLRAAMPYLKEALTYALSD